MKKTILTLSVLVGSFFTTFGQDTITSTVEPAFVSCHPNSLLSKSKIELTQIYLNEVKILIKSLPYSPFTLTNTQTTDSTVTDPKVGLDIPKTRYTNKKIDKVRTNSDDFNKVLQNSLFEILPYSDKIDIVGAILYIQSINSKVKQIY